MAKMTGPEMLQALKDFDTPSITNVVAAYPLNPLCLGLYAKGHLGRRGAGRFRRAILRKKIAPQRSERPYRQRGDGLFFCLRIPRPVESI